MSDAAQPLISVYVPTRNRVALLQRALDSLRWQTYRRIEIIVVDDASTDETPQLLARMAAEEPRLKVVRQPEPLGGAAARNAAIAAATGSLVTGLDDDDYFEPHRLHNLMRVWHRRTSPILFTAYRAVLPGGRLKDYPLRRRTVVLNDLWGFNYLGNQVFTTTEIMRSVGGFDPEMPALQDYDLWIRLLKAHGSAEGVADMSYVRDLSHEPRVSSDFRLITDGFQRLNAKLVCSRPEGSPARLIWFSYGIERMQLSHVFAAIGHYRLTEIIRAWLANRRRYSLTP